MGRSMPVGPYATFGACVGAQRRKGYTEKQARGICGKMEQQSKKIQIQIRKHEPELRFTLAVVYEPGVVDTHEDFATAETIREAAWDFMRGLQESREVQRGLLKVVAALVKDNAAEIEIDISDLADAIDKGAVGDMHEDFDDSHGQVLETYIAPTGMLVDGQPVKTGSWCVGIQWSAEMFEKITRGERTGISMGGTGVRIEATP